MAIRKQKLADKLWSETESLETIIETARATRKNSPRHCRVGDLDETERLIALPSMQRLFLDVIRMVACRAETRMMLPVIQAPGKTPFPETALPSHDRRCRNPARHCGASQGVSACLANGSIYDTTRL